MSRQSPLALAILALLYEEPMHPYQMQQLIKFRNKDEVINVRQRASMYQTIERLLRDGLVAVRSTSRVEGRPERTVYELTPQGREATRTWLRSTLSTPTREFPAFPAALAQMALLEPADVQRQLETRVEHLAAEVERIDGMLTMGVSDGVPRLFMLEVEYMRAVTQTELEWVRAVVDDLKAGRLAWDEAWLQQVMAGQPRSEEPMR